MLISVRKLLKWMRQFSERKKKKIIHDKFANASKQDRVSIALLYSPYQNEIILTKLAKRYKENNGLKLWGSDSNISDISLVSNIIY